MDAQLALLKELSCVDVKHRHFPLGYENGREASEYGLGAGEKIHCARVRAVGDRFLGTCPCRLGRGREWEDGSNGKQVHPW